MSGCDGEGTEATIPVASVVLLPAWWLLVLDPPVLSWGKESGAVSGGCVFMFCAPPPGLGSMGLYEDLPLVFSTKAVTEEE